MSGRVLRLRCAWAVVVVFAVVMGSARPARAQSDRWDRQTDAALAHADSVLVSAHYRSNGPASGGELFAGESVVLEVPLELHRSYAIVAVCDQDCSALGLVLTSPNRYEVDADPGRGAVPVVRVTPAVPGVYRLQVTMVACAVSPCRYRYHVLVRSGGGSD